MAKKMVQFCAVALLVASSIFMSACTDDTGNINSTPGSTNVGNVSSTSGQRNGTASNTAAPVKSNVPPNYGGAIDRVDCDYASGWVWNSADPNADIKVELYIDNQLAETQPARNPRPDLRATGTGNYGFAFKIPASFKDGKAHTVSAKVAGSNYSLPIYERAQSTFNCKP